MPNWCWNKVVFRGDAEDCAAFRELMRAERGAFDFNGVLPMPPELERCNVSDETAYALKYGEWDNEPWWGGGKYPNREAVLQAARHPENAERWVFSEWTGPAPGERRVVPRTFDEAADMAHANVLAHGHVYWHGWCSEHWGTKWNVREGAQWSAVPGAVSVTFETAWAPPLPVLERLGERFPGAEIELEYEEPGMNFAGRAVFAIGGMVEHTHGTCEKGDE